MVATERKSLVFRCMSSCSYDAIWASFDKIAGTRNVKPAFGRGRGLLFLEAMDAERCEDKRWRITVKLVEFDASFFVVYDSDGQPNYPFGDWTKLLGLGHWSIVPPKKETP